MKKLFKQPFYFSVLILFATVYIFMFSSRVHPFSYSIDDPYIHLSIAKNVVRNGVWGATPYEFTSATSSPLWTCLLILCFKVFGVSQFYPLYLNLFFAVLLLYRVQTLCRRWQLSSWEIVIVQTILVLMTPLTMVISTGMEHIMHSFLILSLVEQFFLLESNPVKKNKLLFGLYSFLATGTRYESLFLIFVMSTWFVISRKFKLVLIGIIPGILPILMYGLFSLYHSCSFLPDSIRIKGNFSVMGGPIKFINDILHHVIPKLIYYYYIGPLLLLLLTALVLKSTHPKKSKLNLLISLSFITFIIHILFADIGWNNRYEFYLVALSVVLICIKSIPMVLESIKKGKYIMTFGLIFILIYFLILPIYRYNRKVFKEVALRMDGTFIQQHQMAAFVSTLPKGTKIVINDLGVITFFNDNIPIIDILGLGTHRIANLLAEKKLTKKFMKEFAETEGADFAIIYKGSLKKTVPDEWEEIGIWHDPGFCAGGDKNIHFLLIDKSKKEILIKRLKQFSKYKIKDLICNVY